MPSKPRIAPKELDTNTKMLWWTSLVVAARDRELHLRPVRDVEAEVDVPLLPRSSLLLTLRREGLDGLLRFSLCLFQDLHRFCT